MVSSASGRSGRSVPATSLRTPRRASSPRSKEVYGPALLGQSIFDIETINEIFDNRLAGNPAARAVLDIAVRDAMGKALDTPLYNLIGGCCQPRIPLEWSVSMAEDDGDDGRRSEAGGR